MLTLHHLIASSSKPNWRSAPPPRTVPAIATGPVRLLLAVSVDGDSLQPAPIVAAPATRHLVQTLRLHMDALNVQHVSDAFIEDGNAQIELSPVLFADSPKVHAQLCALRLSYTWSAARHDCHPWAAQHALLLPHREALDGMHATLIQKHLLGSYPYVFGPWRKALEAEKPTIASLARSVSRIVARSPNAAFTRTAAAWLDRIAKQNVEAADAARKALGRRAAAVAAAEGKPDSPSGYEDTMRTALLALYTRRVRPATINRISTAKDRAASPVLQLDDADADAHGDMFDLSDDELGDGLDLLTFDDESTMLDDDDASLLLEVDDEDYDSSADRAQIPGLPAEDAAEALSMHQVDNDLYLDLSLDSEDQVDRDSAFSHHSCIDADADADLPMELFSDTEPGCDQVEPSPRSWHWQLGSSQGSSSMSVTAADHHGVTFPISASTVPDYDMLEFGLDVDVDGSLSQSAVDIDHLAGCEGQPCELGQKAAGAEGLMHLVDCDMDKDRGDGEELSLCAF